MALIKNQNKTFQCITNLGYKCAHRWLCRQKSANIFNVTKSQIIDYLLCTRQHA